MKITSGFIFTLLTVLGCSSSLLGNLSNHHQPRVESIAPSDGAMINKLESIQVHLSMPISPASVTSSSFLVFPSSQAELSAMTTSEIQSSLEDQDIVSHPGSITVSSDGQTISWVPTEILPDFTTYQVLLTSTIQTEDRYPLNQTPGESPTYFMSRFTLVGEGGDPAVSSQIVSPASLVINEVYYDDSQSDTDGHLFIELYGTGGADVVGYSIRLMNGADGTKSDEIIFPENTTLPDDGFFVIADTKTGSSTDTNGTNADYLDNFDPQNGPDSIQLIDPDGQLVDVIGYGEGLSQTDSEGLALFEGEATSLVESGQSLSRTDGIDTGNNAVDFLANQVPSPGTGDVTVASVGDPEAGETETSKSEESATDEEPTDIYFTEVVTDPQQDWNDTSGGNGILFDSIPGDGTIGSTDEWLEIYNGRDFVADLTGWRIDMIDGTDEIDYLSETESSLIFSETGSLTSFEPGGFLVIGNPSGDMKNTITLRLYDDTDLLIDELNIEDANASSLSDESYQLFEDGSWGLGEATIGF